MESKHSWRGRVPLVIVLALLLPVAAAVSVRSRSDELVLEANHQRARFSFTSDAIAGEGVELQRAPGTIVGQVSFRRVELTVLPASITGTFGGKPVRLEVKRTP